MNNKFLTALLCLGTTFGAFAQGDAPTLDTGDTAWMLISTALVMLMTPAGLALFYGGLTQNKSVLNTIGMSYVAFCTGTIVWVVIGYSLAFSEGSQLIGGLDLIMLNGILPSDLNGSIPHLLDIAFQGTFAAIAIAIVSGSIIERVKFSTWVLFSSLWVAIVYSPICHWVWGLGEGSFLHGDLDFAGGTVIHVNAGIAGLVVAWMLGRRLNLQEERKPSSIKLMVLGSSLLWFGWAGFNGGSAYGANGLAASAVLVTNLAASVGGITWLIIEWFIIKKPTLIGVASGVVSGLVAITPAAGFVDVSGAIAIGAIGSIVGYLGVVKLKEYFGHDDTLDAFGMHGLVGIAGAILTGIFANPEVYLTASEIAKAAEANEPVGGLLYGNPGQVLLQLQSIGVTIAYSAVATYIVFKISAFFTKGGRIDKSIELEGMDIGYHEETHIVIEDHNIDNQ